MIEQGSGPKYVRLWTLFSTKLKGALWSPVLGLASYFQFFLMPTPPSLLLILPRINTPGSPWNRRSAWHTHTPRRHSAFQKGAPTAPVPSGEEFSARAQPYPKRLTGHGEPAMNMVLRGHSFIITLSFSFFHCFKRVKKVQSVFFSVLTKYQ